MAVEQQPPTIEAAWDEIADMRDLSRFDSVEAVLDAARDSESLFEAARDARIMRDNYKAVATFLGLAPPVGGGSMTWPPADLEDRIATLEDGDLPADARAHEYLGGGDDE